MKSNIILICWLLNKISPKHIKKLLLGLLSCFSMSCCENYKLNCFYPDRIEKKLPVVLDKSEVKLILNTITNLKHRSIISFIYSAGLRLNEVIEMKVYGIESGNGFQPDFLLFLKQKGINLYYQVFIESKGNQFKDNQESFLNSKEGWKERFLDEISKKYGDKSKPILKYSSDDYILYGLPFANTDNFETFTSKFNEVLEIESTN